MKEKSKFRFNCWKYRWFRFIHWLFLFAFVLVNLWLKHIKLLSMNPSLLPPVMGKTMNWDLIMFDQQRRRKKIRIQKMEWTIFLLLLSSYLTYSYEEKRKMDSFHNKICAKLNTREDYTVIWTRFVNSIFCTRSITLLASPFNLVYMWLCKCTTISKEGSSFYILTVIEIFP